MNKESSRNDRKQLIGVVRSKTGDKSIKVVYEYKTPHPLYKKEIRRKPPPNQKKNNTTKQTRPFMPMMKITFQMLEIK
jgi:ribosomal protein S17